jgi:Holliday junction resolvase RusA-like endonuclease
MDTQEVKIINIDTNQEKNEEAENQPKLTADGQEILPYITLHIEPVAKPRMTQKDKWHKRSATDRYWEYKENLKLLCFICRWMPQDELDDITFVIPMPVSWSEKKKNKYDKTPHQSRPDLDNLVKGFKDALMIEDSNVHSYNNIRKVWGRVGQIILKRY